jgi:aminocarboxymuconate-semialdehyde decarboxylase
MSLIDVHTHILSKGYTELLEKHGPPQYGLARDSEGSVVVTRKGARFMTFTAPMFDPAVRLEAMDAVGVQIELLSYTCPNCYWAQGKLAEQVARRMNDDLADVCARWPERYRGLASIPLQNADLALRELERALDQPGMVGLIILANVNEVPLDDERFEPIWQELSRRRVPTLLHPTAPPGVPEMGLGDYGLIPSIGFMVDTTLAVSRMALGGVFERNADWPLIVSHAGATLPYLAGRLDQCYRFIPDARARAPQPPSAYLKRLYYDTVCYDVKALKLAYDLAGPERLLYGSDYPHNIGDMPGCAARITELDVPEPEKEQIRSGNARRLFGL